MKVLKSFELKARAIGQKKYDWDTLLDGEIRQLEAGGITPPRTRRCE
jgi:hypothetical protein